MTLTNGTFSANVKLHLYAGNDQFELGHLGPDFALLGSARDIDATEGELETIIDGKSSRWKVRFTSLITSESRRFTFEGLD